MVAHQTQFQGYFRNYTLAPFRTPMAYVFSDLNFTNQVKILKNMPCIHTTYIWQAKIMLVKKFTVFVVGINAMNFYHSSNHILPFDGVV